VKIPVYPGDQPDDEEEVRRVALQVDIPFRTCKEWLDLMPFPIFVEYPPRSDEPSSREGEDADSLARACIFGRKFPERAYSDVESATLVAQGVKYFMEHVFPHCVHPRLDEVYSVGRYIDEMYGEKKLSHAYPRLVKEKLKELGGIDFRNLLTTLNNPVLHPETKEVLIYCPAWLVEFNKAHGFTLDDIIASFKRQGEFIPIVAR